MSWFSGARARLHLLFARGAAESRMNEEVAFHIEMETSRLVREEGLSPAEARRRALIGFGGVTQHTEALRDGRGLAWLGGMSLDLKLGFRMLVKYPGLTVIGGLAMAFAIWVGAIAFEMTTMIVYPTLPLPGGDRAVLIRNWDTDASQPEPKALRDFLVWRDALTAVTDLGAYRDATRNLIVGPGDARPVEVAEITAAGFVVAPTRPLLGRVLIAADERPGAAPVAVIGYDVWQMRFAGDPDVIGRSVRIGESSATVVGVMPEGFAFPVSHDLWIPLQPDALDQAPRSGPAVNVFGRLAPGASMEEARAQLAALGQRAASELPATHAHLTPQISPYAEQFADPSGSQLAIMASIPFFTLMLLGLVCGNVALLLFARAATRENELIVRSALGASRGRIIAQLFAEALVLGAVAAAIGLAAADFGLREWGGEFLERNLGTLPFWYDPHLSPATALYGIGLMVVSAGIAGVMPALKVTRGLGSRLRQGTAGGGLRFGGIWTAVIVTQVAVTVAFPAIVYVEQRELRQARDFDAGFPAERYLATAFEMEAAEPEPDEAVREAERAQFAAALEGVRGRMRAEPGVLGVTFVDRLPREEHREALIELEQPAGPGSRQDAAAQAVEYPGDVTLAGIDASYFEVLGAPILAGRAFHGGDFTPDARAVIADEGFVDQVLQGRNAVGRRFRFARSRQRDAGIAEAPQPWYQIVGVVRELGMGTPTRGGRAAGLYFPVTPGRDGPTNMMVHVRGDPLVVGPRVRAIAAAVDPALRISNIQRVDQVLGPLLWIMGLWLRITLGLTAVAILLSLAGIYAVLSFTVARRTREIGVRVALGASRRRVVIEIFRRPLIQVACGVLAGGVLVAAAGVALRGGDGAMFESDGPAVNLPLLVPYVLLMMGVCLLACIVPTKRALRVEPTEAMRAE